MSVLAGDTRIRLKRQERGWAGMPFLALSSNTDEGTTVPHAISGLESDRFRKLESETPGGMSGLGFWEDGAEPSRIVPHASLTDAAHLGLKYDQKRVLLFTPGEGTWHHHVLFVPDGNPFDVAQSLTDAGLHNKTVHPFRGGVMAHLVDDGTLRTPIEQAAKDLGAKHLSVRGTAEFPGADTREEAAREFSRILSAARPAGPARA